MTLSHRKNFLIVFVVVLIVGLSVFLAGSATEKMLEANIYDTLEECIKTALALNTKIILFSPACKSFEKFTNEYDRGQQFNDLVKQLVK